MELTPDQINARFGNAPGQPLDMQQMIATALTGSGPVPAAVATSLAACIGMLTQAYWTRFAVVGSLRRGGAWVGDLDLLVNGDLVTISQVLNACGMQAKMAGGGRLVTYAGTFHVDFWQAGDEDWGAALLELTGPTGYCIGLKQVAMRKGWDLSKKGLFRGPQRIAGRTEEEIYTALGKQWKPPHMRGI